jgi:hypothetical protein
MPNFVTGLIHIVTSLLIYMPPLAGNRIDMMMFFMLLPCFKWAKNILSSRGIKFAYPLRLKIVDMNPGGSDEKKQDQWTPFSN